jgi:hypothetical protein
MGARESPTVRAFFRVYFKLGVTNLKHTQCSSQYSLTVTSLPKWQKAGADLSQARRQSQPGDSPENR